MDLADAPSFLSADQITALVARMSYRPGWELSVFIDPWEGPVFRVVAEIDNAYRPGETVELRINSRIPPCRDEDALIEWIMWRLLQIESHEAREFYRLDNAMIYDPHDPVEPMDQP